MAETYKVLSTASFILALVFLAIAVFLFFKFNIRKIVGDLSGRNAKKSINAMKKSVASSEYSVTDVIYKREIKEVSRDFSTEKITVQTSEPTARTGNITTMLDEEGENSTTVLSADGNATTVLEPEIGETTVLSALELRNEEDKFIVEKEIVFIHASTCLI